jgi:simple sugar transport system permease protein
METSGRPGRLPPVRAAKGLEIFLGSTDLKVASEILAMLPYALTLVILVGFVGRAVAPAASGLAYGKED